MNGLSRRMTLAPGRARTAREAVGIFLELAKFRLSGMVLLTTAVGFVLAAAADGAGPAVLAWTLLGTACSAAGANTLNQWREIGVGSSRVDLQACKLEYSIVSPK